MTPNENRFFDARFVSSAVTRRFGPSVGQSNGFLLYPVLQYDFESDPSTNEVTVVPRRYRPVAARVRASFRLRKRETELRLYWKTRRDAIEDQIRMPMAIKNKQERTLAMNCSFPSGINVIQILLASAQSKEMTHTGHCDPTKLRHPFCHLPMPTVSINVQWMRHCHTRSRHYSVLPTAAIYIRKYGWVE
jgi:hypothetical protein